MSTETPLSSCAPVCALCNISKATYACRRCETPICSRACMKKDWKDANGVHKLVCGLLSLLLIEGKRDRDEFASDLPGSWRDDDKRAPDHRQQAQQRDPYTNLLNDTIATSDAWVRRFAQMDYSAIKDALRTSPTFRYYFANNSRFWYWVRVYHPENR